jgi:hypothetical protein
MRPVQLIAEVLHLVPLSFELHAKEQQRKKNGEEGALHGSRSVALGHGRSV